MDIPHPILTLAQILKPELAKFTTNIACIQAMISSPLGFATSNEKDFVTKFGQWANACQLAAMQQCAEHILS